MQPGSSIAVSTVAVVALIGGVSHTRGRYKGASTSYKPLAPCRARIAAVHYSIGRRHWMLTCWLLVAGWRKLRNGSKGKTNDLKSLSNCLNHGPAGNIRTQQLMYPPAAAHICFPAALCCRMRQRMSRQTFRHQIRRNSSCMESQQVSSQHSRLQEQLLVQECHKCQQQHSGHLQLLV